MAPVVNIAQCVLPWFWCLLVCQTCEASPEGPATVDQLGLAAFHRLWRQAACCNGSFCRCRIWRVSTPRQRPIAPPCDPSSFRCSAPSSDMVRSATDSQATEATRVVSAWPLTSRPGAGPAIRLSSSLHMASRGVNHIPFRFIVCDYLYV